MNKENKRIRSTNFNKEEELLLVQEIEKFKHVIECKTTNKISNGDKEDAWQKVLNNFNAKNFENRSITQIKSKYDNLKTKARKEFAKHKTYLKGTGGGPSIKDELDPVILAILDIINLKTVAGLSSPYDSDTNVIKMVDKVIIEEVVVSDSECINEYEIEELNSKEYDDASVINHFEIETQNLTSVDCNNHITGPSTIDHDYVPYETENVPSCSTPLTGKINRRQSIKDMSNLSSKLSQQEAIWNKYVPSKLKKKPNDKLRKTLPNPVFIAKEQYYKRKLELLEEDNIERKKRIKREEEEHFKKMAIYDLDVELKKNELEKQKKILGNFN